MDLEGRFPAEFERILNLIQTPFYKKSWFSCYFPFCVFSCSFSGSSTGILLFLVALYFSPAACSFNKNNSFTVTFQEFCIPFRNTYLKQNLKMVASETTLFFNLRQLVGFRYGKKHFVKIMTSLFRVDIMTNDIMSMYILCIYTHTHTHTHKKKNEIKKSLF